MVTPAEWNKASRFHDDELARNVFVGNLEIRILAAARSRLDSRGHAHFGRSELATILARLDGPNGDVLTQPNRTTIVRAIGRLIGWGVLREGSEAMCLQLHTDHVWVELRNLPENARRCPVDGLSVLDVRAALTEEERAVTRTQARRVLAVRPVRPRAA